MWYRYLLLIVAVACACLLEPTECHVRKTRSHNNKYCGPQLADILSQLCMGRYNGKMHKKSSYDIEDGEDVVPLRSGPHLQFPFKSRAKAKSLLPPTFKRYVRGVYDECCMKSCSIEELLSYCADP